MAQKIMIVRHAEKPEGADQGVTVTGEGSNEDLIVQGWQRAGALACLFAPARGPLQSDELATPAVLFASDNSSRRPIDTLTPLADKLGVTIDTGFGKGQEPALAAAAAAETGVVLIAWQHENIPAIGNAIVGNATTIPQKWPGDRFDIVWVFDFSAQSGTYSFTQVPQLLLAGDLDTVIGQSSSAGV